MSNFYFLKHKYNSEEEAKDILRQELIGRYTYDENFEEVNFAIDYNNSFGGKGNNDKTIDFIKTYCHGNESEFWDIINEVMDQLSNNRPPKVFFELNNRPPKVFFELSPSIKYDEFHKEDAIVITTTYYYKNKYPKSLYVKIYNLFGEERPDKCEIFWSTKNNVYIVAHF